MNSFVRAPSNATTSWLGRLGWLATGVCLTFACTLLLDVVHYYLIGHHELLAVAARDEAVLRPDQIDPHWIKEGTPTFRDEVYASLPDARALAGTWECIGPAKFQWEYLIDETMYVLSGSADVEHAGVVQHLRPGSVAFFPAGSVATWSVPERIQKTFFITDPGRLRRFERRILFSYPAR